MKTIEVVAALIEKDDNVLATQRGYGEFKGKWEFPGGKIKENENHKLALIREIKEELNADIEIIDFLNTVECDYPEFHLIMHTYICNLKNEIEFVKHNEEELEHDNMVWLEREDLNLLDWLPADIEVIKEYKKQKNI